MNVYVYQSILKTWPQNNIANFGAGNTAFAIGYFDQAEHYFVSYLKSNPDSSIVWNNLSYSLAERGCIFDAKKAIECALKFAPTDQNILESKMEIFQYPERQSGAVCRSIDC